MHDEDDYYPPIESGSYEEKQILRIFNRMMSVFADNIYRQIRDEDKDNSVLSNELRAWLLSLEELKKEAGDIKNVGKNYPSLLFLMILCQTHLFSLTIKVIVNAIDYKIHTVRRMMKEFLRSSSFGNQQLVISVQESKNKDSFYFLKNEIFSQLKQIVPEYDFPYEPPPNLKPYQWFKQVEYNELDEPEWFRPSGLSKTDIKAGYYPVKTITKLRIEVENLWLKNVIPVINAPPASGKTSILRVCAEYWSNVDSYLFLIPAIDWSPEIAQSLVMVSKSKEIILIIDDLHQRNEIDLKIAYLENTCSQPNIRTLIASRPRPYLEKILTKLPHKEIKIPVSYPRELIHQTIIFERKNSSVEGEASKKRTEYMKILQDHQHNIASLVYHLSLESTNRYSDFWRDFVNEKCRYFALKEETDSSRWRILLLVLSFLRTKEVSCKISELLEFLEPNITLTLLEVERMLMVLEEDGLVAKEQRYDETNQKYRLSYHSEFCEMLLKENIREFSELVEHRVKNTKEFDYHQLELSLWTWWIDRGEITTKMIIKLTRNLNSIWKDLPLNKKVWERRIQENKDYFGVQLVILAEKNLFLQGNVNSWMVNEHWISWIFQSNVDERGDIIERWIQFTSKEKVKEELMKLDLRLFTDIEWLEDMGSVFDPGGGGFEPADVHLGYIEQGDNFLSLLEEVLESYWPILCARYLAESIIKRKLEDFEQFICRLDSKTLKDLPKGELPEAKIIGMTIDHLNKKKEVINNLSIWSGPKPNEILLAIIPKYFGELQKGEKKDSTRDCVDFWLQCVNSEVKIKKQINHAEISKYFDQFQIYNTFKSSDWWNIRLLIDLLCFSPQNFSETDLSFEFVELLVLNSHESTTKDLFNIYPVMKNILIKNIEYLSAQLIQTWIKSEILTYKDITTSSLKKIVEKKPDILWFSILDNLNEQIKAPIFSEFSSWTTIEQGEDRRESARILQKQLLSTMKGISVNKWVEELNNFFSKNRKSNSNIQYYFNETGILNQTLNGLKNLDISLVRSWDELIVIANKMDSYVYQELFISVTLKQYPEFLDSLFKEMNSNHPKISLKVLIRVLNSLSENIIANKIYRVLQCEMSFSELKHDAGLTPTKLTKILLISDDFKTILREIIAKLLEEPPTIICEFLTAFLREENVKKEIVPILREKIHVKMAEEIVLESKRYDQTRLLKFFQNHVLNLVEELDESVVLDLIKGNAVPPLWLLKNPIFNVDFLKKYITSLFEQNKSIDHLRVIINNLKVWKEAGRDEEIFYLGVTDFFDPNLIRKYDFTYALSEELMWLVNKNAKLAAGVRNETIGWLSNSRTSICENKFGMIKIVWGHPEALKSELFRQDKEIQRNILSKLTGLDDRYDILDEPINRDWTLDLFPHVLRIELYKETISWILFNQDEILLDRIIKTLTFDKVIIEACNKIDRIDWENSVFASTTNYCSTLLQLLVLLNECSYEDKYIDIGQRILNNEKNPENIQSLFMDLFERENGRYFKKFSWTHPLRELQNEADRFLRVYHRSLGHDVFSDFEKEKLAQLSWKQIVAFLISLPIDHESNLVTWLQEYLRVKLEKQRSDSIFSLVGILTLPYDKREYFYCNLPIDVLLAVDWDMLEYVIVNENCHVTHYDENYEFPKINDEFSYLDGNYNDSRTCEICELYPRRGIIKELWEDMIRWIPDKTEKIAQNLPYWDFMNLYKDSKKVKLWIEQNEKLRSHYIDLMANSDSYVTNGEEKGIRTYSLSTDNSKNERNDTSYKLMMESSFFEELWEKWREISFSPIISLLAKDSTIDEFREFFLEKLPRLDHSTIFLKDILAISGPMIHSAYSFEGTKRDYDIRSIQMKLWKPEESIPFLEELKQKWPDFHTVTIKLITPNLVYKHKRDLVFVRWLIIQDWPFAKYYAELLLWDSIGVTIISEEEKEFALSILNLSSKE